MIQRRNILWTTLTLLCLLLWTVPNQAIAGKYAALVIDASTDKVLYARRAKDKRFPASITKVMTLYMLFEAIQNGRFTMDSRLKVSRKATQARPSKLGLGRGTRIKVKDAIGTLITKSANDVAVVVAEAISGTEKKFAAAMTRKARSLGMKNTTFRNASGLPNSRQVTTAYDIATLAQRIRKDFPKYYSLFKMKSYTFRKQRYRNHNRLLGNYPGIEGLKTGYIHASGYNLVAVAKRNNQRIIAIVFGGKTGVRRDKEVKRLLNLGFARLPKHRVLRAPLRPGTAKKRRAQRVLRVPLRRQNVPKIQVARAEGTSLKWQNREPKVPAIRRISKPVTLAASKPVTQPISLPKVVEDDEIELEFRVIE